jgi:hypothetical protein
MSAFNGFYSDKAGPVDDTTQEEHEAGYVEPEGEFEPDWADIAKKDSAVGSAAQFGD